MSLPVTNGNLEHQHDDVYGRSFALYDKASLDEFIGFLAQRFEANGIDPSATFAGKACLDAGCGNGRGALFMARHGAASVDCVDISPTNVRSTAANLDAQGYRAHRVVEGSLESLPYDDASFDFVWCNGVLMHTANPDRGLAELARVLRPGGKSWIYVYGSDGVSWYWVARARAAIKRFGAERCLDVLRLMRLEARYVAEYIDDWTVPYLRTYAADQFSRRLAELGFSDTGPLAYGVAYDTSHRRTLYPDDAPWLGEGDLRFLVTKTGEATAGGTPLPSEPEAMGKPFDERVVARFGPLLDRFERAVGDDLALAVITAANIQRSLRDILTRDGPFALDEFEASAVEAIRLAENVRR
jgi:ubiquinone/menaquinone biosynthesis C-methylase UbiE